MNSRYTKWFVRGLLIACISGQAQGEEHHDINTVSIKMSCMRLRDLLFAPPLHSTTTSFKDLETSMRALIDALYQGVGAPHAPTYETLNSEFALRHANETQAYWLFDQGVPISFSSEGPRDLVPFTFERMLPPHAALLTLAGKRANLQEFGRWIIHFDNGDTASTPVIPGEASQINPVGLETVLKKIYRGALRKSDGYVYKLEDVETIEFSHIHPESSLIRISPPVGQQFWVGNLGESLSDRTFRSSGFAKLRHLFAELPGSLSRTKMDLTIVSPHGFVLRFPGD